MGVGIVDALVAARNPDPRRPRRREGSASRLPRERPLKRRRLHRDGVRSQARDSPNQRAPKRRRLPRDGPLALSRRVPKHRVVDFGFPVEDSAKKLSLMREQQQLPSQSNDLSRENVLFVHRTSFASCPRMTFIAASISDRVVGTTVENCGDFARRRLARARRSALRRTMLIDSGFLRGIRTQGSAGVENAGPEFRHVCGAVDRATVESGVLCEHGTSRTSTSTPTPGRDDRMNVSPPRLRPPRLDITKAVDIERHRPSVDLGGRCGHERPLEIALRRGHVGELRLLPEHGVNWSSGS